MHWILEHKTQLGVGLLVGLSLGGNFFLFLTKNSLEEDKVNLINERDQLVLSLASSTANFNAATDTIAMLTDEIEDLEKDKDDLRDDLRDEKDRNDEFEDQIKDIAGTVGVLDKLSKTDEELLQKYSKVYFLNENYIPEKLKQIPDKYIQNGKDSQFIHANVLPFLESMIKDAARDDVDLLITSAYRSFDHQHALKGHFTQQYGEGANTFSADQGYSEHQLGTTVDITIEEIGGTYASFADTEAYKWLQKNAHKHGFVLSYPEENGFYIFEPWHWRFVGEDLAEYLDDRNLNFYDMDQRDIDEYLIKIFD